MQYEYELSRRNHIGRGALLTGIDDHIAVSTDFTKVSRHSTDKLVTMRFLHGSQYIRDDLGYTHAD
jgi:hypothetical protein